MNGLIFGYQYLGLTISHVAHYHFFNLSNVKKEEKETHSG